jgi:UDP-glucose 4-epimerase
MNQAPAQATVSMAPMTERSMSGATVLVTGGTGSFGTTVTRHLLTTDIEEVRILSRDETKQDELRRALGDSRARFYLGDVRNELSVRDAMRGVDYVFHTAALKQVPSCEFFPLEAVATNVHGSDNVIRAADQAGVKAVVCLSTDKAVYPINAMGMSKAMMEKVTQAFARNHPESETVVSVVRYGNVVYSRGSVIPLFVEQIKSGQPLTITDPMMTRFLMSLSESVDLVNYAFRNAEPGDLFVRKAPAATVEDLAKAVARLFEVEPVVSLIGTRHGEKQYETLLSREEMVKAQDRGAYYRVPLDARSLDYGLYLDEGNRSVDSYQDYSSHNTRRLTVEETVRRLENLPEIRAALS